MNATVLPFSCSTDRSPLQPLRNNRSPKDTIRSAIVKARFSPDAALIAQYLLEESQPEMLSDRLVWVVRRGQNTIGEFCFRPVLPSSSQPVLRRRTFQAIKELIDRQVISQIDHKPGKTKCNSYLFNPAETWRSPSLKQIDPSQIDPSQIDPSAIAISSTTADLDRSLRDQDQNIYNYPVSLSGERESFKESDFSFSTAENTIPTERPTQNENGTKNKAILRRSSNASTTGIDSISAPVPPQQKNCSRNLESSPLELSNYEQFDFSRFKPDDHLPYFEWSRHTVLAERDRRLQANHPKPIDDVAAYTFGCIAHRGAAGFKKYLQDTGQLPPDAKPVPPPSTPCTPVIPGKSPQRSQTDREQEQWRQASQTLNRLYDQGRFDDLREALRRSLQGSSGYQSNPEKVAWLCQQNPHWGWQLRDRQLLPTIKDLSDLIVLVKSKFTAAGYDRNQRDVFLRQQYLAAIDTMTEEQLQDCLNLLTQVTREVNPLG